MLNLSGQAQTSESPIAIVELFTSQGCSSCPSADKLLKEAVNSNNRQGEIYGLSFHVSYWNRLGWKDPYSSEQFTDRQRWYAAKKRLGRIYTPQMIVDGQDEFVGSQKSKLVESLKSSFDSNKKTVVDLTKVEKNEGELTVTYVSKNNPSDHVINIAVVQKVASNYVPRGENGHKTLVHSNVVRTFRSVPLQSRGQVNLKLPKLNADSEYEVIAYTQDPNTLEIKSVGKTVL